MGVIRNFIEVSGIASENDLPEKSFGQLVKYSEMENIFIPEDKVGIKDIYQVAINIEIHSRRNIKTADCMTIVLDGTKKLKVVYSQEESPDKLVMLYLHQPYNTFFEVPLEAGEIDSINIHILDAYFEVLDKRRIYGHFVYLVDVRYSLMGIESAPKRGILKYDVLTTEQMEKSSESQIALSHEDFFLWDEYYNSKKAALEKDSDNNNIDDLACLYL